MANPKAFQRAFEQVDKLRFNLERAIRHIDELSQSLQTESYGSRSLHKLAGQVGRTRKTFTRNCGHPISTLWRTLKIEPRTDPGNQDNSTREDGQNCDDGDAVMDVDGPSQPESSAQVSHRLHHLPIDVDVIREPMNDKRIRRNAKRDAKRKEREKRRMDEHLPNWRKDLSADQHPPTPEPQVVDSHEHQSAVPGQQQESFGSFGQQTIIERGCDDDLEEDPGPSEVGTVVNLLKPLGALTIDKTGHVPSFTTQ